MTMKNDSFGDRMKAYEAEYKQYLPKKNFYVLRVDMRSGHTYLKHAQRPFDPNVISAMNHTAEVLCQEVQGSICAYTQSDEISVMFSDLDSQNSETWFGGGIQKITSVSASIATYAFSNQYVNASGSPVAFDSRVFSIAEPHEVVNYFLWRQRDAIRNAIQMVAQAEFSHRELLGKSCEELMVMLREQKGIEWDKLPAEYRQGRLTRRVGVPGFGIDQVGNEIPVIRNMWATSVAHNIICNEEDPLFKMLPVICHCGDRVHYGFDGDLEHHRGMCRDCDAIRCDAYPGEC